MILHILSDLHTEFHDFDPPATGADVVVLAGDIGNGTDGIEWAAQKFAQKPVIYVPGNHEYYDVDIGITDELRASAPPNVHVLSNETCELAGVRFLGTTLWTDFRYYGEGEAFASRKRAQDEVKDFVCIRNGERMFTPEDSIRLHDLCKAWLVGKLEQAYAGPTVVVTHHLPASPSVADVYRNNPLNPAFVSHLDDIIERYGPDLWIHGHTHEPCDYELFGTRVICNPRGYPGEKPAGGFSPGLVVNV